MLCLGTADVRNNAVGQENILDQVLKGCTDQLADVSHGYHYHPHAQVAFSILCQWSVSPCTYIHHHVCPQARHETNHDPAASWTHCSTNTIKLSTVDPQGSRATLKLRHCQEHRVSLCPSGRITPTNTLFTLLPFRKNYRSIRAVTARLCNSFFPQAVNNHMCDVWSKQTKLLIEDGRSLFRAVSEQFNLRWKACIFPISLLWQLQCLATVFLATQIVSVSFNMKPQKKAALYLIYCNKGSEDRCPRMGGPRTVKPIFTSQPSDLSNYSLFLRADRGDYQYTENERWFFSGALCLSLCNQWILFLHLFGPTHPFPLTTCLPVYHPLLIALNRNLQCTWHTCVHIYGTICMCKWTRFLVIGFRWGEM